MPNIGAYHPVIVHFVIVLLILGVIFRWISLTGIAGVAAIVKAADRGGDLVYSYAGGVGTRSGDTADVTRLYLAGLYQAAQQARAQHDSAHAAELFVQLERQFPNDTTVRLLAIESLVRDRHDSRTALAALARFSIRADDRRLQR